MYSIRQLMQDKSDKETYSVSPQAKVEQALALMADKNIGAVMVVDADQMVGIFTERDFARKAIVTGKCSLDTPVAEVMTQQMFTIQLDSSLEECMNQMTAHRIRHLPVMDKGRLVGMVSMRDVVEALITKKDSTIERLESYILGTEYGK
jgi:CBS domain-containing protein